MKTKDGNTFARSGSASCTSRSALHRLWLQAWLLAAFSTSPSNAQESFASLENLGGERIDGYGPQHGHFLVYGVSESFVGRDLNGDGDEADSIVHLRNLRTDTTICTGFAAMYPGALEGYLDWVPLQVSEFYQGEDLNGDGDRDDTVLHLHQISTGATRNLRVRAGFGLPFSSSDPNLLGWVPLFVSSGPSSRESSLHLHNLSTGETTDTRACGNPWIRTRNGFAFNRGGIVGVFDLDRREAHSTTLPAGRLASDGEWILSGVAEEALGVDLNGDGDKSDRDVLHAHHIVSGETRNLGLSSREIYWFGDSIVFNVKPGHVPFSPSDQVAYRYDLFAGALEELGGGRVKYEVEDHLILQRDDGSIEDSLVEIYHASSREVTARFADAVVLPAYTGFDPWLVLLVSEKYAQADWNGDGDVDDNVLLAHDVSRHETKTLGAYVANDYETFWSEGSRLIYPVDEAGEGRDLDGDGDVGLDDGGRGVVFVHDFITGETSNLRTLDPLSQYPRLSSGTRIAIGVREGDRDADLNGDGDREDTVVHIFDTTTKKAMNLCIAGSPVFHENIVVVEAVERAEGRDLNGDEDVEDHRVIHVHDTQTGITQNLGVSCAPLCSGGRSLGDRVIFPVDESAQRQDLNGDGDIEDAVIHLLTLSDADSADVAFRRGDSNTDRTVDISDAITTLGVLFLGGDAFTCTDASDANDDGLVDISDPIVTLQVLLLGQVTIPPPGLRDCGRDPTKDGLSCAAYEHCS